MIDEISERFDLNLSRVENLISIYEIHIDKALGGRKKAHDTDILRAALVLLHASLEDFLRSILSWKLPESGKTELDKIPLLGQVQKNPDNFKLGSLVSFREKTVEDLIKESVQQHTERWSSFNDVGQIKGAVTQCGLEADGVKYDELNEMVLRRHNIVHKADATTSNKGDPPHQVRPIGVMTLNLYVKKVREFKEYVSQQLIPVEYCPRSSFPSFSDAVLYLLEKQEVTKSSFCTDMTLSRSRSYILLRDMITLGHALIDIDGKTIRSGVQSIDEADALLRRFCKNHTVFKEISRNKKYNNSFREDDFVCLSREKCRFTEASEASQIAGAKTLLRYFWGVGYVLPKGDNLSLLEKPLSGPYSIASAEMYLGRQFNMFFGESPPTSLITALSGLTKEPLSRSEAEKKYKRNSIYALLKLGLISIDGTPLIPKKWNKLTTEELVRIAAAENDVISFVCNVVENEPKVSGVEIGNYVAERFGCDWVRRSKQRNGASLARWAAWLDNTKDTEIAALAGDADKIVEALRALKEEDFGTLQLVSRYTGTRKSLGHGRPAQITKEILEAVLVLKNDDKMNFTEIAKRIGVSRAAIYRAIQRHKAD